MADDTLHNIASTLAARTRLDAGDLMARLADPDTQTRLVELAPAPQRAGQVYQTTYTQPVYALVEPGEEPPGEIVREQPLAELRDERLGHEARLSRMSQPGRMTAENREAQEAEAKQSAVREAERLMAIDAPEARAAATVEALSHCGFSDEELGLVRSSIESGDTRLQKELFLSLTFVEGPDGALEPSYVLSRWSATNPIPKAGAFGPGSRAMSIEKIATEVHFRADVLSKYGADVAREHGLAEVIL